MSKNKVEENATVTHPQLYSKGDIEVVMQITNDDGITFCNLLNEDIIKLIDDDLDVEIQYAMNDNYYSALVIGRLKNTRRVGVTNG